MCPSIEDQREDEERWTVFGMAYGDAIDTISVWHQQHIHISILRQLANKMKPELATWNYQQIHCNQIVIVDNFLIAGMPATIIFYNGYFLLALCPSLSCFVNDMMHKAVTANKTTFTLQAAMGWCSYVSGKAQGPADWSKNCSNCVHLFSLNFCFCFFSLKRNIEYARVQ